MSGPFINAIHVAKRCRYALLAGTMLSTLALPQMSIALDARAKDGAIVVAQNAPNPNDPNQKGKKKDGGQPKAQPGAQPGQPPGKPQAGQPPAKPQAGQQQQQQPKQFGRQPNPNQPAVSGQPPQGNQPPASGQPGQPKQFGGKATPNQPPANLQQQQKQFGGKPKPNQPVVGNPPVQQGNQPAVSGQPKQFGRQNPNQPPVGGQPPANLQGNQPPVGGQPKQKQFGKQPNPNQPVVGGQPQQNQFGRSGPPNGQPQGFANVDQLRSQRRERTEANGARVIEEPGNRLIVNEGGRRFIRNDDGERFRRFGNVQSSRRGSENFTVYSRPGGYQIVNVTDSNGRFLRRVRRGPDGREVVLIENRRGPGFGTGLAVGLAAGVAAGVFLNLPPPVVTIPRERYIVDGDASPDLLYDTLEAPPLVPMERAYSLDEVRYNVELRDRVRRVDINTVTFESGSWEVAPEQYDRLAAIASAMQRVLQSNQDAIFMIEGHTDAVGTDEDNLSLSDRRAESVAVILSQQFQISPENLVTQGYGEQYLKVPTDGPMRENRRVAVRNVTRLLDGKQATVR